VGARFSASVHTDPGSHPATYKTGTACFPGLKRPGRGVDHPTQSSVEVKKKVELYLYSPYGPSALVARPRVNLPFSLLGGTLCQFVGVKRPVGTVFYLRRASIFPSYTENAGIVQELHKACCNGPADPQHTIPAAVVQGHDSFSSIALKLGQNSD
jgi:hypothetical protein